MPAAGPPPVPGAQPRATARRARATGRGRGQRGGRTAGGARRNRIPGEDVSSDDSDRIGQEDPDDTTVPIPAGNEDFSHVGPASTAVPGHSEYYLSEWSVTLSLRGAHVPTVWISILRRWMAQNTLSGIVSYELGRRERNGHIQGVIRIRFPIGEVSRPTYAVVVLLGVFRASSVEAAVLCIAWLQS